MFSIIIPTMWKSDHIYKMIAKYKQCDKVGEIIIIDNGGIKTHPVKTGGKVKVLKQRKNIYVNPAWNLGASVAKYGIILVNDDIYIDRLNEVLDAVSVYSEEYDLIAIERPECNVDRDISIKEFRGIFERNRGCFIYLKNYTYIPEQIKVVAGDAIFLEKAVKPGLISGFKVIGDRSETRNAEKTKEIIEKKDIAEYTSLHKQYLYNIIIRTCNRKNYFKECIKSIKALNRNVLLHIVVENEEDLKYVNKYCYGMDYNYYVVNPKTIKNFSSSIKTDRMPFTPNYYFNVVKPFLKGWVVHLDDDDKILKLPKIPKNTRDIVLSRVNVGWVVPEDKFWGKEPELKHISNLGIMYHSSMMEDFTPQKGGDFYFIKAMYDKAKNVHWNDEVVASVQFKQNYGNKQDL